MMNPSNSKIDMHLHVGLLGDRWPEWGHFTDWYRRQIVYKIFLLYGRVKEADISDTYLRDKTIEVIGQSKLDKVVCLALDPVYDSKGKRRPDLSHVWVDNDFIIKELREKLPDKVLLGASVHPYDLKFKDRVKYCVDQGAVLLKWLPSVQFIDLAEDKARDAMISLAKAGPNGKPLPLLLHVGPEYAIPTSNEKYRPYDYLSWTWRDKFLNFFRGGKRWHAPKVKKIHKNIKAALDEGVTIIFAHCGVHYFASGLIGEVLEHNEFNTVKKYLERTGKGEFKGKCYGDVSAFCTPVRIQYAPKIKKLPPELILFGSDFPTPAFELSADLKENMRDLKAILKGDFYRIIIPQDNLLDVNYNELQVVFPDHKMFTNFNDLM
ncbi:MAG: hypothetical protein GY839_14625 [candidate division Zixibacteria bacterium]|nr:hypothetical protein [candidate division Zixibacteria bacterium]